jgi:hypothetical protein
VGVLWGSVALVVCLIVVVRPIVAAVATVRTNLSRSERAFIGLMDPRGIVAASTAATFAAPLTQAGIAGAEDLLPATFLVIVGTVTVYGLTAAPPLASSGSPAPSQSRRSGEPGSPVTQPFAGRGTKTARCSPNSATARFPTAAGRADPERSCSCRRRRYVWRYGTASAGRGRVVVVPIADCSDLAIVPT